MPHLVITTTTAVAELAGGDALGVFSLLGCVGLLSALVTLLVLSRCARASHHTE